MSTQKFTLYNSDNQSWDFYSLVNLKEASHFLESTVRYGDIWSDAGLRVRRKALVSSSRLHNELKFLGEPVKPGSAWPRNGIKGTKPDYIPWQVERSVSIVAGEIVLNDEVELASLQEVYFRDLPGGLQDTKYRIRFSIVASLLEPFLDMASYAVETLPEFMEKLEQPMHPDYADDIELDRRIKRNWLGKIIKKTFGGGNGD